MSDGMYLSLRNFTLRSLTGHTVHFKAGEPSFVPFPVRRECMAHGIMPASGKVDSGIVEGMAEAKLVTKPFAPSAAFRRALLFVAVQRLVNADESGSFDAGSRPKPDALSKLAGFAVQKKEAIQIYEDWQRLSAGDELLPTHKFVDLWYAVLEASNKDEIELYAGELGVQQDLSGVSVAEGRKFLQNFMCETT